MLCKLCMQHIKTAASGICVKCYVCSECLFFLPCHLELAGWHGVSYHHAHSYLSGSSTIEIDLCRMDTVSGIPQVLMAGGTNNFVYTLISPPIFTDLFITNKWVMEYVDTCDLKNDTNVLIWAKRWCCGSRLPTL